MFNLGVIDEGQGKGYSYIWDEVNGYMTGEHVVNVGRTKGVIKRNREELIARVEEWIRDEAQVDRQNQLEQARKEDMNEDRIEGVEEEDQEERIV